ncbi:MAG: DMT family transporter [Proteobacteria bacterium]|nr:DMT family transporter [Pseudomonadota bacterium]MBU1741880.1 DMT family transporter [Pseudomonadota bacterium]
MKRDGSILVGIGLVNLATLTWATNAVIGRYLRHDIGPVTLAAARFSLAAVVFWALFRSAAWAERPGPGDRWLLLGMALSGVVGFTTTYYLGLRLTTAVDATLINGLGPIATAVVGMALFRDRTAWRQIAGALVALGGVAVLMFWGAGRAAALGQDTAGHLIILGSVTLWGFYSVFGGRVMVRRSAWSATAWSIFLGVPFLLAGAAIELWFIPVNWSFELLGAIIYVAVAPSVIGYASWNAGVRRLGPVGAMIFINTLPLYGALLGFLVLDEPLGWGHLAGGGLIVLGALGAALSRRARGGTGLDAPGRK